MTGTSVGWFPGYERLPGAGQQSRVDSAILWPHGTGPVEDRGTTLRHDDNDDEPLDEDSHEPREDEESDSEFQTEAEVTRRTVRR